MPYSIAASALVRCEEMVRALAVSPLGEHLFWAGDSGRVHAIDLPSMNSESFDVGESVAHLVALVDGDLIIGTFAGDLHRLSSTGEPVWTVPLIGGSELMLVSESRDSVALIDGAYDFHLVDVNGTVRGTFSKGELTLAALTPGADRAAVADDEGRVTLLDGSAQPVATVLPRCGDSVRITAMTFLGDGALVICSEAVGLSDAGVPQVAIECIAADGSRLHVQEADTCATTLHATGSGIVAGFADGRVLAFETDDTEPVVWTESPYSIGCLQPGGDHLLVGSWFHLRRFEAPGVESWMVEHPGLVERLATSRDGRMVAIAGENRNDWTRINRIDVYDIDAEPYELTEDDIDLLLPADDALFGGAAGITPDLDEDLMGLDGEPVGLDEPGVSDVDDPDAGIEHLLTEQEAELWHSRQHGGSGIEEDEQGELMELLGQAVQRPDDTIEQDEAYDLLTGVDDDATLGFVAPKANAGNDRTVDPGKDGTAEVTLDGSRSSASAGQITDWLWRDAAGVRIGETPRLRVRLPVGRHRFSLTVSDSNGTTASDAIHIMVTGEVEEDEVSLLD